MKEQKEERDRFSVSLTKSLKAQISQRAQINKRSLNSEITALLEQAIDVATGFDLQLMQTLQRGLAGPKTE